MQFRDQRPEAVYVVYTAYPIVTAIKYPSLVRTIQAFEEDERRRNVRPWLERNKDHLSNLCGTEVVTRYEHAQVSWKRNLEVIEKQLEYPASISLKFFSLFLGKSAL